MKIHTVIISISVAAFLALAAFYIFCCGSGTSPEAETHTILIPDGLVAYYPFNEGSGNTAGDLSGNDLSGEIIDASWTTGKVGDALYFNGTSSSVRIPASGEAAPSQISALSEGTVSLWFKFEGEAGDTGIFYPIFYLGSAPEVVDTIDGFIIEIGHKPFLNTSQQLFCTVTPVYPDTVEEPQRKPIQCFNTTDNLTPDVWYHFAVTVGSSGNTGYLNGQEMTDRNYYYADSSSKYFLSTPNPGMLSIGYGRAATDGNLYYFKGVIDEVRIYNRALSASEILQLYQE